MNKPITVFPTHKTELKTKLPRHEVLKRLETNDFYVVGYDYKLVKNHDDYTLKPVHEPQGPRNDSVPVIMLDVKPSGDYTHIFMSFRPFTAVSIIFLVILLSLFAFQVALTVIGVNAQQFNILYLLPTFITGLVYLISLIIFSLEVISIRKQIEELLEAEIHEVTEDEMSKLQKWYEKKR